MKRIWAQAFTAAASAIALGALMPACVHDDQTLFIEGVLAPPTERTGSTCLYEPTQTPTLQFSGTFDVGIAQQYFVVMQLGNQMLSRGSQTSGDPVRAESSRISIQGAVVTITDATGATLKSFTTLGSTFVDIGQGGIPGLGIVGVTGIDPDTAKAFCDIADPATQRQVILNIKAFGQTLGGTDVESNNFEFPVSICKGCLVDRSDNCQISATESTDTGGPCVVGNDVPISCGLCTSEFPNVCVVTPQSPFATSCAATD